MKLSVRDPKSSAFYAELNQIGFDGIDFSFPSWNEREQVLADSFEDAILETYQRISDAGLQVCQTHLTYYPGHYPPLGDGSYEAFEECILPILTKEIALVAKMHCRIAVIHLYFEPSRENSQRGNLRLIERLLPELETHGVTLCIENIYGPKYGEAHLTAAEDLLFYTDHFRSTHLGICLDTGHAVTRKQDPIEMITRLGTSLHGLHIHANVPERDLHLPPFFTRTVDWHALFSALESIGYGGAFNMEISAPKQLNRQAALAYYRMVYQIADSIRQHESNSWMDEE